ncbi:MAG: hypothetical protein M1819_004452 [Sarea resinae]|nr:MAG: hypothetical protein M1819_004452 [Sarea resinae]
MFVSKILAVAGLAVGLTKAQSDDSFGETIHSSVVVTRHGERTPVLVPGTLLLTQLGAQQLYAAGSVFRDRYVVSSGPGVANVTTNSQILGISEFGLDNDQLSILSTDDLYMTASAQAFMQGLYPPLDDLSDQLIINSMSILANGSDINTPLGGYQYPLIETVSPLDPNSIWINGMENCPEYSVSGDEYYDTANFKQTQTATNSFYQSFQGTVLDGIMDSSLANFVSAYEIFDYANYAFMHNVSVRDVDITYSDLTQLRVLADQAEYAKNGNTTASGLTKGDKIRTIAGKTLAAEILGQLYTNIESGGADAKLSLLFSSYEPFLSFFALADLPNISPNFYGLPDYGSSLVFELYSYNLTSTGNSSSDAGTSTAYPSTDDMMVRFLFRNGTGDSQGLMSYPLFGQGPDQPDMTFADFALNMGDIMLGSADEWCSACNSPSLFCAAYNSSAWDGASGSSGSSGSSSSAGTCKARKNSVSPAVGGVIGALVTLAVMLLALLAGFLLGGLRLHRVQSRRTSASTLGGGFKKGEKLASDPDLVGSEGAATEMGKESGAQQPRERVGSWELGGVNDALGPGDRGDGEAELWKAAVRPVEHV